jgi:hypothetical protein
MKRGTKKMRRRPRSRRRRLQRGGQVPTFHILIATAGRPALKELLDTMKPQLTSTDAITIVFDGKAAKSKSGFSDEWKQGFKCPFAVFEEEPALGFWGHGIRNKYQGILTPETTFIMHADDDDLYTPDAFEQLRKACVKPDCLYISKFKFENEKKTIPSPGTTSVQLYNVSTQNGIVPFKLATKATWESFYGGDGAYYTKLSAASGCTEFLDLITVIKRGIKSAV